MEVTGVHDALGTSQSRSACVTSVLWDVTAGGKPIPLYSGGKWLMGGQVGIMPGNCNKHQYLDEGAGKPQQENLYSLNIDPFG